MAPGVAAVGAVADFQVDIQPLLENYCYRCHGNGKHKGGLAMDEFKTAQAAVDDPETWDAILTNLRDGVMPPEEEKKQPKLEEREALMAWIKAAVFAVDPEHPDPGRVTLRRLNRVEYNNTIRDLVGVDFNPADDFPADDSGYGFDNIGDVLSLPPVLFERYLQAAEEIMGAAILNDHKPRPKTIEVDLFQIEGGPKQGTTSVSRRLDETESFVEVELPVPGLYTIKMRVESEKVGPDKTRLGWNFAGQNLRPLYLRSKRDDAETVKTTVKVAAAGKFRLVLQVANPLDDPVKEKGKPVKRMITVRRLQFISPPQPVSAPPSQVRIFAPGRGQPKLEYAARAIIRDFGKRAFRRPLSSAEVERFLWLYQAAGRKRANFEQSVQTALTAILVSPHFLFRGELQPDPDNPQKAFPIDEWSLASRLSYFLWSTIPDDELFAHAEKGTLRQNLAAQVERMLKDPRSNQLVENFAGQWLQIRNVKMLMPDPKTYPDWSRSLAIAMQSETEELFSFIMRENRSVLEFLGADYTFVNEVLARHYGIDGVQGEAFVKVALPANRPGGILGQGSFLALTSNPNRTSPVKRGKFVLENLLASPPPPPPPDVPDLNDGKRAELKGTLRHRMEQHRADPICASCHARMDPIGFGLEHFDGIGAWRDEDEGSPIDPSGKLVSGETFRGPAELRKILLTEKRADFLRCLTEKMLTYALGRGLEYYDRPAVEKIAMSLDQNDGKFSSLIMGVIESVPFQMRRGEGDHRDFAKTKKTAAQ